MKKIILFAIPLILAIAAFAAEPDKDISKLPKPDKKISMTLFDALQKRHSVRSFSDKAIDKKTLSNMLWAATGINREDGKMTAPTAMDARDIIVYVADKDGVSLYLPVENSLKQIIKEDIRPAIAERQKNMASAPIFLLLISDTSRFPRRDGIEATFAAEDAGYVSQNICLAAEALGLATVPRHMMDRNAIKKALNLNESQLIMLNHPIGYEAKKEKARKAEKK